MPYLIAATDIIALKDHRRIVVIEITIETTLGRIPVLRGGTIALAEITAAAVEARADAHL